MEAIIVNPVQEACVGGNTQGFDDSLDSVLDCLESINADWTIVVHPVVPSMVGVFTEVVELLGVHLLVFLCQLIVVFEE